MDGGQGDDTLVIGNSAFAGTLTGGAGNDILRLGTASLMDATLSGLEVLEVTGTVTARAGLLNAFVTIRKSAEDPNGLVRLQLGLGTGALDLTGKLGAGSVVLAGSSGGDLVTLGGGQDTAEGLGGNDSLVGGAGADWIDGGEGNDRLDGGSEEDTLTGDLGDDTLLGGAGNDVLIDLAGAMTSLSGGMGDDVFRLGDRRFQGTLAGGSGLDRLEAGLADLAALVLTEVEDLVLTGGIWARAAQLQGFDRIEATGRAVLMLRPSGGVVALDLTAALGPRAAHLIGTTEAEALTTGAGDDRIEGGGGRDTLTGGAGADWLIGGMGNDILTGGEGNDTLVGSYGSDLLYGGAGADFLQDGEMLAGQILAGAGDDRIEIFGPGTGLVDGGEGVDVLANLSATGGVDMAGLTLVGIEVLETRGQPIRMSAEGFMGLTTIRKGPVPGVVFLWLVPSAEALDLGPRLTEGGVIWGSVVTGSLGADTILGGAGPDTIAGGNGDDLISGGLGRNALTGGNGVNSLTYAGFDRPVSVSIQAGQTIFAGGQDTIAGFRRVIGSEFDDRLEGGAGDNTLIGGAGQDVILGQGGADRLEGGLGDDQLWGGTGADVFVFASQMGLDQIMDLAPGDVIDLSALALGLARPEWLVEADEDILIQVSETAVIRVVAMSLSLVEAAIIW